MPYFARFIAVVFIALATVVAPATSSTADLLDPIINILPPRHVPYYPSKETACVDGNPACIDATIIRMQSRLDTLAATCDHDAVFALAYLRVTQEVRRSVQDGLYRDPAWLGHQDAVFAGDYFKAIDDWHGGHKNLVSPAWSIALQAADDGSVTGLGNFMLAMNAHINSDFSYVLAGVGLTAPDGRSHKPDHNAFNPRLDSLYNPVFAEEAKRFDPTFGDIDAGPLDDVAVGVIMRGWREIVWRNAESLALAKTPFQLALVKQSIATYATTQALFYKTMFASSKTQTAARDAYCAAHHGS